MKSLPVGIFADENSVIAMDPWTQPFWEAGKSNRLVVPCCRECKIFRLPPLSFCANCHSQAIDWIDHSRQVELYSFTICQRKVPGGDGAAFVYIPVVVELPEAQRVRLMGNLIEVNPAEIRIGMKLEIDWHPIADGWKYPIFRPF